MRHHARPSVRDALRLRAAALALLGGARPDWGALAAASAPTWDAFLRTERCALALKSRLAAAGLPVLDEVEAAATRELQRILSARGHLRLIGQLATAHAIPVIVLKGGVAVLTSAAPVDVADVDVLVHPVHAAPLAELLEKEGFSAAGLGGGVHLTPRIALHAVQIEVHFAIPDVAGTDATWQRARPIAGAPGLARLGAADHLWHLLVHAGVTHPHRRGALRDVLLTADALRDCSPAELGAVVDRVTDHALAQPLVHLLRMAQELGRERVVRDRFRHEAAGNYLLRGMLRLPYSRFWSTTFVNTLFEQLGGRTTRRHEWKNAWQRPSVPSLWGFAARLERHAPLVGRVCRTSVKVGRLICARVAAWPVAVAARFVSS
jgi:Uncharacterised nucleotidyltransferase